MTMTDEWLKAIEDVHEGVWADSPKGTVLEVLTTVVKRLQYRESAALGTSDPEVLQTWNYWVANDGTFHRDHADPGPTPWVKLVEDEQKIADRTEANLRGIILQRNAALDTIDRVEAVLADGGDGVVVRIDHIAAAIAGTCPF